MPSSESRPDLQLLLDAVVDYAIYMLDLDGRIVSWNSGAERLKQYSSAEILGQHFSRFYTPEDRAAEVPSHALQMAKETGRFHAEGWRIRKDGTRFWALVVIDAIRNPAGELVGFAKITRDITDKFDAHQELAQSESRYRRLIEAVVDYAIFQLDATGHVSTWNPGAERIKGYASPEIMDSISAASIRKRTARRAFRNVGWKQQRRQGNSRPKAGGLEKTARNSGRL